MGEADWVEAGLLDPGAPDAPARRELLEWLESQGSSLEDMVAAEAGGELATRSADRQLRPHPTMTREEIAARVDMAPDALDRLWLAAGFPPPPSGVPYFTEGDLPLLEVAPAAAVLFGEDTVLAFARVMGASMARIAEAADAMFLTDVEGPVRAEGATPLELAKLVHVGVGMLAGLPDVLAPLFRRHAAAAVDRSRLARTSQRRAGFVGADRVPLTVGFADLVAFTALSERTEPRELAAIIGRFERNATDRAVAAGVRVVKSIGDAVMVVGTDPLAVVDVLAGLAADVEADPALGSLRAAAVAGDVLTQGGDYVGPTVNLAARATKEAPAGGVVVNEPVAAALAAAGRPSAPLEPRRLRGMDDPVVLWLVAGQ
jgi:class 3 adenylate cyclase